MKPCFPIHHTFGPLITKSQWWKAFVLQFQPQKWREGKEIELLRQELGTSFGSHVALFGSGRDALLAALRAIELTPGDEVIIQGFTCAVISNAIHAAGGVPVYCDIDPQTLNLDIGKLHHLITHRTRAVICQHTFGIPAETRKIKAICEKRGIMLIEDCAHVIPDSGSADQMSLLETPTNLGGIGTYGDALIFSFGRDKAISGVTGGAVLTRHVVLAKALRDMEDAAMSMSMWNILKFMNYPLRYSFAKWLWRLPYGAVLAKSYLRWIRAIGLLSPVLTDIEKHGSANIILGKIPNACAALALQQLESLASLNSHRRELTMLYLQAAESGGWHVPEGVSHAVSLQKFPVFARDAQRLRSELKREEVYLDDGWCDAVVNPRSVDQESAGYAAGTCPIAEDVSKHIVTLPTHPTMSEGQARYLIHALRSYLG